METVRETAAFLPVCLFVHRNRTLPQIPPEEVCYYYYRTRSSPLTSPTYFPNTTTPFLFSSLIVIESKFWVSASRRMEWSSFESTSESPVESLESSFSFDEDGRDLTVFDGFLAAQDDVVAVQDSRVDHAVALDLHGYEVAASGEHVGIDGQVGMASIAGVGKGLRACFDGVACRDSSYDGQRTGIVTRDGFEMGLDDVVIAGGLRRWGLGVLQLVE
mgnify:CR=1 FL=1